MTDDRRRALRPDELRRVANAIDPRAEVTYCAPILGGLDAATYALDLEVAGARRELVLRIYTMERQRDGEAARRHWAAISGIPASAPIPVPRGVLLDAEGALLGLPSVVMTRLPGVPLAHPKSEERWIDELAAALAAIHAVDSAALPSDYRRGSAALAFAERQLVVNRPVAPGPLWHAVTRELGAVTVAPRSNGLTLTHHDFWFGNTLWTGERLTGLVDWGEARIHDPAFDVSYARLDMHLVLGPGAAARLQARYEARRGPLHEVPFWDLVSVLPAFRWLDDWVSGYHEVGRADLTNELARERLESFVRSALKAL